MLGSFWEINITGDMAAETQTPTGFPSALVNQALPCRGPETLAYCDKPLSWIQPL